MPDRSLPDSDETIGGDPVCWAHLLCLDCGAMLQNRRDACWRCGKSPEQVPVETHDERE
ncbi:hypothetical protein [Gulosibacter faecalis]|jgi:predicted amidophosphoribosyltransferase|uniref:Uncharacterized protein n=1 Tax=Gulosibacter faecalis TaxID=272240 RepID=A0ABW5UWA5_9MICO|nr:hypothetical protein [Gulosibacter faecalis]